MTTTTTPADDGPLVLPDPVRPLSAPRLAAYLETVPTERSVVRARTRAHSRSVIVCLRHAAPEIQRWRATIAVATTSLREAAAAAVPPITIPCVTTVVEMTFRGPYGVGTMRMRVRHEDPQNEQHLSDWRSFFTERTNRFRLADTTFGRHDITRVRGLPDLEEVLYYFRTRPAKGSSRTEAMFRIPGPVAGQLLHFLNERLEVIWKAYAGGMPARGREASWDDSDDSSTSSGSLSSEDADVASSDVASTVSVHDPENPPSSPAKHQKIDVSTA